MIYFVRHGESEANVRNVFAGQKDDSLLTEKGKEQALATAKEIKKENLTFDRIISSPLQRSLETARIIAKEIGFDFSNIIIDNRINEYDMGSITGKPYGVISSEILVGAENAENPELFKERVYFCIKELNQLPENILVVSHAGVGRILETIKEGKEAKYFYDLPPFPNASIIKIDWIK
ncbi:MAG: phosphoglycerate mutase family protein [Candidatus Nomurabacteria bacterium]|nr:phosphoglycerate mutase family protein [Candidatus Nomurabacteria bacterium]